jgi:RimJ/RimL family protein N-acetyltransferase
MKKLMLQHAFKFVERVIFLVGPANHRSQRALTKIGAVHLGSRIDEGGRERNAYQIDADTFRQDSQWNSS